MVNALGLCQHNNIGSSCPTCIRQKAGFGDCPAGMNGGMGADCQPGFYKLKVLGIDTGQCLPSLSTAAGAAQAGVLTNVATGVATSPANIAAAKSAGISAAANKSIAYIKAHPVMIASVVGGIALLAMYGTGKLAFGRR